MSKHASIAFLVLSLFNLHIVGGCRPGRSTTGKPKLIVGAVLSKTAGAAAYGSDADLGAKLAVKELNAQPDFPFKIEYITMDDKSDQTEATKVARTLIDVNKANVILGPAISPSALSVGKLAEDRQIPIVSTSATLDTVTWSDFYDRKYVFRVCFNDSYQGKVLAKFATDSLKLKKAAIIYDKTLPYSIGLSNTFRTEFTSLGGQVMHEENYLVTDTDYSALIDKVAGFDVDLLFIPGWDENVGPMLKQSGDKWKKFTMLGGDGWPTNRLLDLSGGNIGKAYALSHYSTEAPTPEVKSFDEAFHKEYNAQSTPFNALGYDAMMLIADAAKRAESVDGKLLREALSQTDGLQLVTGSIRFDDHRNPQKDAIVVQIRPNKIVFYSRVRP
jgi:branched-chain amino acid transport system substrate-binding protein